MTLHSLGGTPEVLCWILSIPSANKLREAVKDHAGSLVTKHTSLAPSSLWLPISHVAPTELQGSLGNGDYLCALGMGPGTVPMDSSTLMETSLLPHSDCFSALLCPNPLVTLLIVSYPFLVSPAFCSSSPASGWLSAPLAASSHVPYRCVFCCFHHGR